MYQPMKFKTILFSLSLTVMCFPCFAQDDLLMASYNGIQMSVGNTLTDPFVILVDQELKINNRIGYMVEGGIFHMGKLGGSAFYFESGAFLSFVNNQCQYTLTSLSDNSSYDEEDMVNCLRLKLPIYFDYCYPIGKILVMPSFGLAITGRYAFEEGFGFGFIIPHFGLSVMVDKYIVGASWDYTLGPRFSSTIQLSFTYPL